MYYVQVWICVFVYLIHIYRSVHLEINAHAPPMIHRNLLFESNGSWEVGNLRCENIDRDQISPKFLKLEMRKHWQGSNFSKIPKISATMVPALPIDARILGILGKFDPCQCFRISGFRNFGEI